jgi:hypothetical protein
MTPDQVEALEPETYAAFVRHMQREAREVERAAARARQRRGGR